MLWIVASRNLDSDMLCSLHAKLSERHYMLYRKTVTLLTDSLSGPQEYVWYSYWPWFSETCNYHLSYRGSKKKTTFTVTKHTLQVWYSKCFITVAAAAHEFLFPYVGLLFLDKDNSYCNWISCWHLCSSKWTLIWNQHQHLVLLHVKLTPFIVGPRNINPHSY